MNTRKFALWGGIAMLAIGILAFLPGLTQSSAGLPALNLESSYDIFLGFFPMNVLSKILLIVVGVAGIACSRADNVMPSVKFSRTVFIVMGLLAICGFIPGLNTMFGYMPLFGGQIFLNGLFAAFGAYFGYAVPVQARSHV